MKTLNYLFTVCVIATTYACSDGKIVQNELPVENRPAVEANTLPAELPFNTNGSFREDQSEEVINSEAIHYLGSLELKQLDSLKNYYTEVAAFSRYKSNIYYYVIKGEYQLPEYATEFPFDGDDFSIGLVSGIGENLLPPKYDLIGSIGAIAPNTVELHLDGKIGLYNISSGSYVHPKYDYILPSKDQSIVAYGKFGDQLEAIYEEKGVKIIEKEIAEELEAYITLGWRISTTNLPGRIMLSPYVEYHENDGNMCPYFYILPKYWQNNLARLAFNNLCIDDNKFYAFGTEEVETSIKEQFSIWDNIKVNLVRLYEIIGDGRGYTNDQLYLVSQDKTDSSSTIAFQTPNGEDYMECACDLVDSYKIVQDSLFEYKAINSNYEYGLHCNTAYTYANIKASGEIEELATNRYYSFTKWVKIDPSYFKGCYFKGWNEDNKEIVVKELNTHDLDVMRNEIFADYGYKFKSEQWHEFFSKFKWYQPKHENVDSLLTDIDRYNIEVILTAKNSLLEENKEPDVIKRVNY